MPPVTLFNSPQIQRLLKQDPALNQVVSKLRTAAERGLTNPELFEQVLPALGRALNADSFGALMREVQVEMAAVEMTPATRKAFLELATAGSGFTLDNAPKAERLHPTPKAILDSTERARGFMGRTIEDVLGSAKAFSSVLDWSGKGERVHYRDYRTDKGLIQRTSVMPPNKGVTHETLKLPDGTVLLARPQEGEFRPAGSSPPAKIHKVILPDPSVYTDTRGDGTVGSRLYENRKTSQRILEQLSTDGMLVSQEIKFGRVDAHAEQIR